MGLSQIMTAFEIFSQSHQHTERENCNKMKACKKTPIRQTPDRKKLVSIVRAMKKEPQHATEYTGWSKNKPLSKLFS